LRFDGLPPGKYLVRAEVGEVFRDPLVLAGAPVALEAGATASVTLVLGERPRSGEPVPLAGTLYLPEAWGPSKLSLSIEPLNRPQAKKEDRLRVHLQDMEPVQGQPGLYRWDAGSVVPGTYQAQLNDFQYQMVIEVGAAGRRDVEIRIGEPALVAVRVVDAETGSNVDAGEVLWNCRRPEGIHGGGMNSVPRDAATDSYRFRAPVGPISVDVHPTGYLYAHQTLDVVPGENALTLEVTKGCGLIITVREGDLALPWDLVDKALKIREVDGKGGMRGWQKRGQAKTFNLSRPGTYELKVAKLDGYAPVAPVTVEVRKGEYREHTIELRRE
jgi:hypothetical protein